MNVNVVSTVIFSIVAGANILALISSLHRSNSKQAANPFLILLLGLLLAHTLGELLIASGAYRFAPQLVGLESPLRMLMGPALYFYAHSMMSTEKLRAWPSYGWALFGPAMVIIIMLPFFQLSAEEKLALSDPATRDPALFRRILLICTANSILFIGFTFTYLAAAMRLQNQHRQRVMANYANIETRALDWFRILLVTWGVVWLLYTLHRGSSLLGFHLAGSGTFLAVCNAVAIIAFSHLSLRQQHCKLETPHREKNSTPKTDSKPAERKPCLPIERMRRIAGKLTAAMEKERLFADNELSLRQLSDITQTSTNHISETFSQHLETNFFQFVNQYRIAEAKRLLESSDDSITTIAFDVGYNSRSTFNSKFKKDTGMTPTDYRTRARSLDTAQIKK